MHILQRDIFCIIFTAGMLSVGTAAMGKTIVTDGGLDKGKFVNTSDNYMQLPNGSTVITGWTVTTSAGDIVWAKSPTGDGLNCAQGKYCVDLTGFGNDATNGAVSQTIHLKQGVAYTFSMDCYTQNDAQPQVTVGSQALTLVAGMPFMVNGSSWTPYTASLTGSSATKATVLTIENLSAGAQTVFVDNISIVPQ